MPAECKHLNQMIIEVRYKPNPKVLDRRGELAEDISDRFNIPHWKIDENRIDFFDSELGLEKSSKRAFLSYRNFGLVYRNVPSSRDIVSTNDRYFNLLSDIGDLFPKKFLINRIGVKSRFGVVYKGNFSDLFESYKQNLIIPTDKINSIFNTNLVDIGVHLDFKDSSGTEMRTLSGPMEIDQIKQYFPFENNYPETILFFEIDTFSHPNTNKSYTDLKNICEEYLNRNWDICEKMFANIQGE